MRVDGGSAGLRSVVRDSAGIAIIENERPAAESRLAWEVEAEPSLSIGAVDSGEADQFPTELSVFWDFLLDREGFL